MCNLKNIKVERIISDNFQSNIYIVKYSNLVLVIDPGETDCKELIKIIENKYKNIDYCFITHEHFDHNIGYGALANKFKFKTICSKETGLALSNAKTNLSYYYNIPVENKIKNMASTPDFVRIIETPGHSKGSVCFLIDNLLFSGDTIIKKEFLVTKLPGGCKEALKKSFIKIDDLSGEINDLIIFPGHGEMFKYKDVNFL